VQVALARHNSLAKQLRPGRLQVSEQVLGRQVIGAQAAELAQASTRSNLLATFAST
jgi:hypothetical protein